MKFGWRSLLVSITTAVVCGSSSGVSAQATTAVPMTIMGGEGMFVMTVPDRDTTKSAFGGRLRRYDVHIAKMFEVTHHLCQNRQYSPSVTWVYRAGNGSIEMGTFEVSCKLAQDLAIAYGFRAPETTKIIWFHDETGTKAETMRIPVFDITPKKSDRWMTFTSNFKPAGR